MFSEPRNTRRNSERSPPRIAMKTTAQILNVLLIMMTVLLFLTVVAPSGPMWILALLAIVAPIVNILALRDWQIGRADSEPARDRRSEPSKKQRRLAEKKPLYEWIETVERRLAAIESAEGQSSHSDGS